MLVLIPGCGPKKVRVSGKFVKNGVVQSFPVDKYVTLQFVPVDPDNGGQRRSYPARIDNVAGTYEVELLAGKYYISLFIEPPKGPAGNTTLVRAPTAQATDKTEYDFKSNTTQDIMVP